MHINLRIRNVGREEISLNRLGLNKDFVSGVMAGFLSYFSLFSAAGAYEYMFLVDGVQENIACSCLTKYVEYHIKADKVLSKREIPEAYFYPGLYSWYIRIQDTFFLMSFKTKDFVYGFIEFIKLMHANVDDYCYGRPYKSTPGDLTEFDEIITSRDLVVSPHNQELEVVTSGGYQDVVL